MTEAADDDVPSADASGPSEPSSEARRGLLARFAHRIRHSRAPVPALIVAGLLEATFVPIPVELALIPMAAADRRRIPAFVAAVSAGNLLGAIVMYGIAWAVADPDALGIIEWLGGQDTFADTVERFQDSGFSTVMAVGVSPVPLQLALLAAGAAGFSVPLFLLAVLLGRGLRYSVLGVVIAVLGERTEALWKRHKLLTLVLATVAGVALWGLAEGLRGLLAG